MTKKVVNRSKYLSYLLRHHPEEVGCDIDEYGWVNVKKLIQGSDFTKEELKTIVEEDTRYTFSEDGTMVRAFHGHSIPTVHYQQESIPKTDLYHGTSEENAEKIMSSGYIKGMSRIQVHLSINKENALKIGQRHGKPCVFKVDTKAMIKDGFKFYESGDGVWLTSDIPVKYIEKL